MNPEIEERKWLGQYLQSMLDDWRCSSTEVSEIAAALLKGERPNYDIRKYQDFPIVKHEMPADVRQSLWGHNSYC